MAESYWPVGVGSQEEFVVVPVGHQDVFRSLRLIPVHVLENLGDLILDLVFCQITIGYVNPL